MITKEELQQYISITKEIPDEIGLTPEGEYNTRYIGEWGVYAFCWLPPELVEAIKVDVQESHLKMCKKLSWEHHGEHRFICNLPKDHEGLCVGFSADNDIAGIFVPDEDAPSAMRYIRDKMRDAFISIMKDAEDD